MILPGLGPLALSEPGRTDCDCRKLESAWRGHRMAQALTESLCSSVPFG